MGIAQEISFEKMAVGALVSTSAFFAGGNTNPNEATVQRSRIGSAQRGDNYFNYKRTVAAAGYNIHDIVGGTTTALRRWRFYFTLLTAVSANTPIVYALSVATNRAQIFMATTRTLQLRNVTTAVGVASAAMVIGKKYRFEYMVDPTNSQQELFVYEPDEVTKFYDSTATNAGVKVAASNLTMANLRVGNATSCTLEYDIDDFAESDLATEIGRVDAATFGFAEAV